MSNNTPRVPPARILNQLGIFVLDNVLSPAECERIVAEMQAAPGVSARLGQRDGPQEGVLQPDFRQSTLAQISPERRADTMSRLLAVKPRAERFFGVELNDEMEPAKFLIYEVGNFFKPHRDRRKPEAGGQRLYKVRRVNLILFLNAEADPPGPTEYSGGQLIVYGLLGAQGAEYYGIPIISVPGRLVGFRSNLLHEVTPIEQGTRYNIVSRFLDPLPPGVTLATEDQNEAY